MEVSTMNIQRFPALLAAGVLVASLGACASTNRGYNDTRVGPAPYSNSCYECGTVEAITPVQTTGTAGGTGAVLGGIVGGVVGSQVGDGDGQKVATVAGVVGGAVAGNAIEKNMTKQSYQVTVRMDDGRRLTVTQGDVDNDLRVGSRVKLHESGFQLF
jgi:outer membrane lipoprotein SlyB